MTDAELLRRTERGRGGPVAASRAIGVSYDTWKRYKRDGSVPAHVRHSLIAHLALQASSLHVFGDKLLISVTSGGDQEEHKRESDHVISKDNFRQYKSVAGH